MRSLFFYFDDPSEDPRLLNALEDMLSGSDRAVAIQGAALVDSQLRAALLRRFGDKGYVNDALSGREFLSSFSARITTARMLGLFSDRLAGDLQIVRRVRNDFAHDPVAMSFSTPSIRDRCRNLTVPTENIAALGSTPKDDRSFIAADPSEIDLDSARFRYIATCAFFTVIASAAARYAQPLDIRIANH